MKSQEFCFWLQGFFEVRDAKGSVSQGLSAPQVETVKRHLALVFKHEIDPSYSADPAVQDALQKIHDGLSRPTQPPLGGGYSSGHSDITYRC
jgi:hypothetical protein